MRILIPVHGREVVSVETAKDIARFFNQSGNDSMVFATKSFVPDADEKKQINSFGFFDIVLSINYTRNMFDGMFDNEAIKFITWVQDGQANLNKSSSAETWNELKNDWMFGYVQQLYKYGYNQEKLIETPFYVCPHKYRQLNEDREEPKENCDRVVLVSRKGDNVFSFILRTASIFDSAFKKSSEDFMQMPIDAFFERAETLVHMYYNDNYMINNPVEMGEFLCKDVRIQKYYDFIPAENYWVFNDNFMFWGLNDRIFRQTVVKWLIDCNTNVKVYGSGWKDQVRFKKIAEGEIDASNISSVYSSVDYGLHLGSSLGMHQRPIEMLLCGCTPVYRDIEMHHQEEDFDRKEFIGKQAALFSHVFNAIHNDSKSHLLDNHNEISESLANFKQYSISFKKKADLESLINHLDLKNIN